MRRLADLRADTRGTSLLEFALGLPLVMAFGGYGIEVSNLALAHLRVNQVALQIADNGSRIGTDVGLASFQLREGDINDLLQGARLAGAPIKLTTNGRVIVTSLENVQQSYDTKPVQRMHWQRCIGARTDTTYQSSYGTTSTSAGSTANAADAGTAAPNGMGDAGSMVTAPAGSGLIFVEVNYEYQPIFGTIYVARTRIHYTASFIVRDRRDYSQIWNPQPTATPATCNKYPT